MAYSGHERIGKRVTHIKFATPTGLYAITPESLPWQELLGWAEILLQHGVLWFQYRRKHLSAPRQLEEARCLQELLLEHHGYLIINDNVDLALEVNAYGVHLGAEDLSLSELAKHYHNHSLMVGASCYQSLELAQRAHENGAHYVAFGSVFPSTTKPHALAAPLTLFRSHEWSIAQVGRVAIGGITPHNAAQVLNAGAQAIAVVSALSNLERLSTTIQQFQQLITESRMHHDHVQ
ncbi:MAG: thiamine-phosphate diphosphorylase [Ferrovum sp. 34-44-207]|nr:MAG: thiamine-phosphate diphosphorylase [Ferrovum sp. 34-44-207]